MPKWYDHSNTPGLWWSLCMSFQLLVLTGYLFVIQQIQRQHQPPHTHARLAGEGQTGGGLTLAHENQGYQHIQKTICWCFFLFSWRSTQKVYLKDNQSSCAQPSYVEGIGWIWKGTLRCYDFETRKVMIVSFQISEGDSEIFPRNHLPTKKELNKTCIAKRNMMMSSTCPSILSLQANLKKWGSKCWTKQTTTSINWSVQDVFAPYILAGPLERVRNCMTSLKLYWVSWFGTTLGHSMLQCLKSGRNIFIYKYKYIYIICMQLLIMCKYISSSPQLLGKKNNRPFHHSTSCPARTCGKTGSGKAWPARAPRLSSRHRATRKCPALVATSKGVLSWSDSTMLGILREVWVIELLEIMEWNPKSHWY